MKRICHACCSSETYFDKAKDLLGGKNSKAFLNWDTQALKYLTPFTTHIVYRSPPLIYATPPPHQQGVPHLRYKSTSSLC